VLVLVLQTTPKWAWSGSRDPLLNFGAPITSLKWWS